MNEETKTESLLDGDFSCETTEDSLLDERENYDWVYIRSPKNEMEEDWKCVSGHLIPF